MERFDSALPIVEEAARKRWKVTRGVGEQLDRSSGYTQISVSVGGNGLC